VSVPDAVAWGIPPLLLVDDIVPPDIVILVPAVITEPSAANI